METEKLVAAALDRYKSPDSERAAAIAAAIDGVAARPDLGSCPVTLELPRLDRGKLHADPKKQDATRHTLERLPPRIGADVAPLLDQIRDRIARVTNGARPEIAKRNIEDVESQYSLDWDLVLVKHDTTNTNTRALVWSYTEHRVLCVADVQIDEAAAARGDLQTMYDAFSATRDGLVLAGAPRSARR